MICLGEVGEGLVLILLILLNIGIGMMVMVICFRDSVELNYTDTGVYYVELIAVDSFSCSDTAIKVLNVYPLPDISMSKDTSWGVGNVC